MESGRLYSRENHFMMTFMITFVLITNHKEIRERVIHRGKDARDIHHLKRKRLCLINAEGEGEREKEESSGRGGRGPGERWGGERRNVTVAGLP